MYIRIVQGQPQPGHVEEVARRWKEHLAPQLRSIPGFRAAYFISDQHRNTAGGITFWDDKPGKSVDQAMQELRQRVQEITLEPPVIVDYEVLAEA
jgi:hypothetical protein